MPAAIPDPDDSALAALLAAVHANPDDDAPRLVYADALLERGDPQGELITLQCRAAPTYEQRERATKLVEQHGHAWIGPLGAILVDGERRFARGFLARGRIESSDPELVRAHAGAAAWATVTELRTPLAIPLWPTLHALRKLAIVETTEDAWRDLLVATPRALTALAIPLPIATGTCDPALLAALATCSALPALHTLTIVTEPGAWVTTLLHAPVARRVATLTIATPSWRVTCFDHLARATIAIARSGPEARADEVHALAEVLPASVTAVCVQVPDAMPESMRAAIAAIPGRAITLEVMVRCTIVRCPRCDSTDASAADQPTFGIDFVKCDACGHHQFVDHYQLKFEWNVDRELVFGTGVPPTAPDW